MKKSNTKLQKIRRRNRKLYPKRRGNYVLAFNPTSSSVDLKKLLEKCPVEEMRLIEYLIL